EMLGGLTETVIPRNTPIPAIKAREFTTAQDNQSAMSIHVLQGERSLAKDCRSLARFSLSGIPAGPAGSARIRLLFNVDENGLLSVSAQEQQTGQQVQVACDRAHSFDRGELRQLLEASEQNLDQDQQQKRHIQAEVDARQLLQSLASALASSGNDLLNTDERTEIEAQMADLEHQIAEANLPGMRRLTAELSEHTDFFAQRRMNQAAQSMLQGRNIDEVAAPSALEPK
ncbi:MAG: Hsp70 family protein, partial [Gammaproteobacteria bacterium]